MDNIMNEYNQIFNEMEKILLTKKLPKLKIVLRSSTQNIENLIELLIRKSLLKKDLYNYDQPVTDSFKLIEEKTIQPDKIQLEIYLRLKSLISGLNYLSDTTPSSFSEITDNFLDNCRKAIEYFAIHNLVSASNVNSRILKDILDKAIAMSDTNFKKMLSDNIKLLRDNFLQIKMLVEDITKIIKDNYKAQFRFEIFKELPEHNFNKDLFHLDRKRYLESLILFLPSHFPSFVYNPHYIEDAINECYNVDDITFLNKLKNTYFEETGKNQNQEDSKKPLSPRERLINMIFELANTKNILQDLYIEIDFNIKLLKNKEKSFLDNIKEILRILFKIEDEDNYIDIEYVNPSNKKIEKESIKIDEFLKTIKTKLTLFEEILKPKSEANFKIKNGTEASLFKFMETHFFSTFVIKERIVGINNELSIRLNKNQRKKMKDISKETTQLDAILNKINESRKKLVIDMEHIKNNISTNTSTGQTTNQTQNQASITQKK